MQDYYQILETSFGATQVEIRDQYRFLLHAWHPDKFPNPVDKIRAQEKTRLINEAYEILGDPRKRDKYNHAYHSPDNRTVHVGSSVNPIDNYEWLLHFKPNKQYSVWLDPGFNPYEWDEGSTPEIRREWQGEEYQVQVTQPAKTAIAAFSQVLSDILITVRVHFLPETAEAGEAGILFGIGYTHYLPARYYRFGLTHSGGWKFSYNDRSQGETVFREGFSAEANRRLAAAESVRLIAASYEDSVLLGIDQTPLGEMVRIPQLACGAVGVFVTSPAHAAVCGAGFSSFRPYFIKQS
jgi:hypothetical protein